MDKPEDEKVYSIAQMKSIHRNALAYGWEIGHGAPLNSKIESSEDNPFTKDDWEKHVTYNQ